MQFLSGNKIQWTLERIHHSLNNFKVTYVSRHHAPACCPSSLSSSSPHPHCPCLASNAIFTIVCFLPSNRSEAWEGRMLRQVHENSWKMALCGVWAFTTRIPWKTFQRVSWNIQITFTFLVRVIIKVKGCLAQLMTASPWFGTWMTSKRAWIFPPGTCPGYMF